VVEVGRDLWRSSGPTHLLKQGHLEQAWIMSRQLLSIFNEGNSTTFLGDLFQCPRTLCEGKKLFPDGQM